MIRFFKKNPVAVDKTAQVAELVEAGNTLGAALKTLNISSSEYLAMQVSQNPRRWSAGAKAQSSFAPKLPKK